MYCVINGLWKLAVDNMMYVVLIIPGFYSRKTRESAGSPHCNCQHVFPHSQSALPKTQSFVHVSSWEGILTVSSCTTWANSGSREWHFAQAKWSFFLSPWEKGLEIVLDQAITYRSLLLGRILFPILACWHTGTSWLKSWWKHFGLCIGTKKYKMMNVQAMHKCSNIFHQCNVKPTFAYIHNMCNGSNIFLFPHVPRNFISPTPPNPSIALVCKRQQR